MTKHRITNAACKCMKKTCIFINGEEDMFLDIVNKGSKK